MSDDFSAVEFVDNPEPRCPVVLLLDRSYSMDGAPMEELNQGLAAFAENLKQDALASLRVEVAVITFGLNVRVLDLRAGGVELDPESADANQVFVTATDFYPPTLTVNGQTPLGGAVEAGLKLVRERKAIYKQNGIDYFRPIMFLITDGTPTDRDVWPRAAEAVRQEEGRKGLSFFGIGTETANLQTLAKFSSVNPPARLRGLMFKEMFLWLSRSLSSISNSRPGEQVSLPSPNAWGVFDTTTQ